MNCFAGLLNFLLYVVNIVFLVSLPRDHTSDNNNNINRLAQPKIYKIAIHYHS